MKTNLIPPAKFRIGTHLALASLGLIATLLASTPSATFDVPGPQPPPSPAPVPAVPTVIVSPAQPSQPAPAASAPLAPAQPATYLAWSSESVDYSAKPGEVTAHFTFYVTNVSEEVVIIHSLIRACGCTEAKLPQQPWTMNPGTNGPIMATIDLRGKSGRISKPLTVNSSAGSKVILLNVDIPLATGGTEGINMDRNRNVQLALADRQAVFAGECAKCHAEPTVAKTGKELYDAGCAICHDATHRAAMVPDLRTLGHSTNADHWKQWITSSKPGSLMPAFGHASGGPLSETQIASLVTYLVQVMPSSQGR